jgi:hypothetical protein
MRTGKRLRVAGIVAIGFLLGFAPAVLAQAAGAAPGSAASMPAEWRLTAGAGWVSWRDVVRSGPPVDASPVAWRGAGTAFLVQHDSRSVNRLHRLTFKGTFAGHFSYESSVGSVAEPRADRFRAADVRYEYRRYPFRDVVARGLDVGVGIETRGGFWSRTHAVPVAIETHETAYSTAVGIVLAGRWHRPSAWRLDVAWINGIVLAHATNRQTTDGFVVQGRWGGGWLTDLVVSADVPLSRRTGVAISYLGAGDGTLTGHGSVTTTGRQLTLGVTYAR